MLYMYKQGTEICRYSYGDRIRAVRMNRAVSCIMMSAMMLWMGSPHCGENGDVSVLHYDVINDVMYGKSPFVDRMFIFLCYIMMSTMMLWNMGSAHCG